MLIGLHFLGLLGFQDYRDIGSLQDSCNLSGNPSSHSSSLHLGCEHFRVVRVIRAPDLILERATRIILTMMNPWVEHRNTRDY